MNSSVALNTSKITYVLYESCMMCNNTQYQGFMLITYQCFILISLHKYEMFSH